MNPGYYIPEGSPDRQHQETSKKRGFLGMVKLPFQSNFKHITHRYQSKLLLKISTNSKRYCKYATSSISSTR